VEARWIIHDGQAFGSDPERQVRQNLGVCIATEAIRINGNLDFTLSVHHFSTADLDTLNFVQSIP
jgi:hypothetical protein